MNLILVILLYLFPLADGLKNKEVLKGINLLVPVDFVLMTDDDIAQKYPTHKKPLVMLTSSSADADFGVNYAVNRWNSKNLTILRNVYKSTISSIFTSVDFIKEGEIVSINNREFIIFEFVSELIDDNKLDARKSSVSNYTLLAYTIADEKILIFNFSCNAKLKSKWASISNAMIFSLKIANSISIADYTPIESDRKIKKSNDPQMEMIRKMKNNKAKSQD